MQRKIAGYLLLSVLSFIVHTTLFMAVANAQVLDEATTGPVVAPSVTPTPSNEPTAAPKQVQYSPPQPATPTPTTATVQFTMQSVPQPTATPTPTEKPEPTKAPVPTAAPTAIPTVAPTAVPLPTATPLPKQSVTSPADLEPLFAKYAAEYSVDANDLKSIARCEAGFNPQSEGAGGLYTGMFQFSASTWSSNRTAMGLDPNPDLRKNAEESIRTAAFMIKRGSRGAWPNC